MSKLTLVLLGLGDHAFDLLLGETALVIGDGNTVGFAGSLVRCRDIQDTIGINIEGDLDLWHTTGCRRDARELELAEQVVVLGAGTLTLIDLDEYTGLVVGVGGESLRLLRGDGGVTLDEGGHHTTSSLNTVSRKSALLYMTRGGG